MMNNDDDIHSMMNSGEKSQSISDIKFSVEGIRKELEKKKLRELALNEIGSISAETVRRASSVDTVTGMTTATVASSLSTVSASTGSFNINFISEPGEGDMYYSKSRNTFMRFSKRGGWQNVDDNTDIDYTLEFMKILSEEE